MEGQQITIPLHHQHLPTASIRSVPSNGSSHQHATVTGRSIPPKTASTRKHGPSGMSNRMAIHPPVCGAQPGRILSLRTSQGLTRVKTHMHIARQQRKEKQVRDSLSQSTVTARGRLKRARLQPLGVVCGHMLLPLGIVPVTTLESDRTQRPKSSTYPVALVESFSGDHTHQHIQVSCKTKVRKHSQSAGLPQNFSDETMRRLLSLSQHTALVSHSCSDREESKHDHTHTKYYLHKKELPTMVTHGELGMKIEVKGIREYSPKENGSPRHEKEDDKTIPSSLNVDKFPPITNTDPGETTEVTSEVMDVKMIPRQSQCRSERPNGELKPTDSNHKNNNHSVKSSLQSSPRLSSSGNHPKMAIVSIGKLRGTERVGGYHGTKRHSSGGKGRLSLGWSPPQPIEPLRGSPLHTPNRTVGKTNREEEEEGKREAVPSPTPSMGININVNELLQTENEPS